MRKTGRKIKKGKRGRVKRSQASACAVDHDAVLDESGQAAALHANQISQLRGLFVRWHRWVLRARTLPSSVPLLKGAFTDPHTHTITHRKQQTPWFSSTHLCFFSSLLLFLSLCSVCLGFCLVAVAMFALFQTPSICFVHSGLVFVFLYSRKRININLQDHSVVVTLRWSFWGK